MPAVVRDHPEGGYRYIAAVFQYSGGVAAAPGFAIHRAQFRQPLPLAEGFAAAEAHLKSLGRPRAAFCACELRSPAPFTEAGFLDFNRAYAAILDDWGILRGGLSPVARTNVCPGLAPPSAPAMHAFCYTIPQEDARPSFIVAGGGEVPEGRANYRDHIVRRGDLSPEGMREKVRFVAAEMAARVEALGFSFRDARAVNAYSVRDIGAAAIAEIFTQGIATGGLLWHYCRPPIEELEFEMDVRAPADERVIS